MAFLLGTLLLAGCASAPVQEMSNARQAIMAARQACAQKAVPDEMASATHWLDEAEAALQKGAYGHARASALRAKKLAVAALRDATEGGHQAGEPCP